MVGFTLLSRSYYYLRGRSPAPPFPPDHRQAGERGAIVTNVRGWRRRHLVLGHVALYAWRAACGDYPHDLSVGALLLHPEILGVIRYGAGRSRALRCPVSTAALLPRHRGRLGHLEPRARRVLRLHLLGSHGFRVFEICRSAPCGSSVCNPLEFLSATFELFPELESATLELLSATFCLKFSFSCKERGTPEVQSTQLQAYHCVHSSCPVFASQTGSDALERLL